MRNRSENQIELVLIRHGATRANEEYRYLGKTDEALSQNGVNQLLEYKRAGLYPNLSHLFISPMKRCRQTAEIVYPHMESTVIAEWTEIDFGAFEGKNHAELEADWRYQQWIDSNAVLAFPDGESREEFVERCDRGMRRMQRALKTEREEKEVKRVGIIVHGGTIMALLSSYCSGDYFDYQVANARGYIGIMQDCSDRPKMVGLRSLS